jgi:uncharacterized protein (DUF3084 family)
MSDDVLDRMNELEGTIRRAVEALGRLREENDRLRREVGRMTAERKQMAAQVDSILNDIGKLEL